MKKIFKSITDTLIMIVAALGLIVLTEILWLIFNW